MIEVRLQVGIQEFVARGLGASARRLDTNKNRVDLCQMDREVGVDGGPEVLWCAPALVQTGALRNINVESPESPGRSELV